MGEIRMDERTITLQRASLQFAKRFIWHDASLSVDHGEFIAILGPNGAGKTSLLRVLLGMLHLSGGGVYVFGKPPQRGNKLIGYVPQRRTLDPDLPVRGRDLVTLGVEGLRWGFPLPASSRQTKRIVDDVLDAVGGTLYADRPIGQISGGEQQRLLLAQALVGKPRLLLLDEPLANLDLRNQESIAQLVGRLARTEHITVLLVTHDINPVLPVMDRVIYIAGGNIVIGTPDEIITSETLSALYGANVQVVRDSQGRYLCSGRVEDVHPYQEEENQK
jgi:zinc/manganese transport system ATP-binding protein